MYFYYSSKGCLSSWFKHHEDLLQAVLPMILGALSQPDLAPSAALAFKDVCSECHEMLSPLAVQLIPACKVSNFCNGWYESACTQKYHYDNILCMCGACALSCLTSTMCSYLSKVFCPMLPTLTLKLLNVPRTTHTHAFRLVCLILNLNLETVFGW